MFKWKKLGRVFDPREHKKEWLQEFAQAPATHIMDDRLRVFFACRPNRDNSGRYVSYTGYVDLDLENPLRIIKVADTPVLELGDTGCFDEHGTYPLSVIKLDGRLLAFYAGWSRCESVPYTVAIGNAWSDDDGESFQKCGPGPVFTINQYDPYLVSGPKIRKFNGIYYLFYISTIRWVECIPKAESIYKIRFATSTDCITWNRSASNIIPDVLESNECQASPDVIELNGKFHMFFSYKYGLNFRGNDRGYRIGYAFSDDLMQWTRDDRYAGIHPSGDGWESQSIAYPHVFRLNGKIYMLYLGNDVGRHGFGIAELENLN